MGAMARRLLETPFLLPKQSLPTTASLSETPFLLLHRGQLDQSKKWLLYHSRPVDDGYTVEASLADVQACADWIVSFRNQGGFSIVAPEFPGNAQVKGGVEIQVK